MDRITKSLQDYLKTSDIKFEATKNKDTSNCKTSTFFELSDTNNSKTMTVLVEVSPETHTIYITVSPHIININKDIEILKCFEAEWNHSQRLTSLSIVKESIDDFYKWYNIQLYSVILSDGIGLTRLLWHKYLDVFFNETLQIWEYASLSDDNVSEKKDENQLPPIESNL